MKTLIAQLGAVAVLGLLTVAPNMAFGQVASTTTTITTRGTVTELTPNAIAVKVKSSATPVRYAFTRTTTYVDENGNPVSIETVRTGVPVTVYYEKNGSGLVADKVVLRKSIVTTDAAVPTTTTTTVSNLPTPPTADGIVSDADSDEIAIRTPASSVPVHYKAQDATAYVDENGSPVSRKSLTAGTPVTIFYEQDGDSLLATRVVVKNPAVIEKTTTTTTRETTAP